MTTTTRYASDNATSPYRNAPVYDRHRALELAWYGPGTTLDMAPADVDGVQAACFEYDHGYAPRCAAELDAYSDGEEALAEYLAANPVVVQEEAVDSLEQEPDLTPTAEEVAEDEAPQDVVPKVASACGRRIGKRIASVESKRLWVRVQCGQDAQAVLLADRAKCKTPEAWPSRRKALVAGIEAAIVAESGDTTEVQELLAVAALVEHLAPMAGKDVAEWCKAVSFSTARELLPLVERDRDTDVWGVKAHIGDDVAALSLHLQTGKVTQKWAATRCRELQAAHYKASAAGDRTVAATLPEGDALRTKLTVAAEAADKRAAKLLAPPAKKAAAETAPAATTPATVAAAQLALTPGMDDMAAWEQTLENLAGHGAGGPASPECRAAHAITLLSYGVTAADVFADRLCKDDDYGDLLTAILVAIAKRKPNTVAAALHSVKPQTAKLERAVNTGVITATEAAAAA